MAYKRISPIPVIEGGTGALTLTDHGVILGQATSAVVAVAPSATTGVALVSAGAAADPAYGTVVPAGGGTGLTDITAHNFIIGNGTGTASLLAPSATSGVPLISQGAAADPAYGTAVVEGGGTGATSLTDHGVLLGSGTAAVTVVAPSATAGVPFVSTGASSDPDYGTAVVAGGGTGNTTFTAYSVICAGTTATGAFQNVSGVGTSGQVLTSNGAAALPTWEDATGGGGITWAVTTIDASIVAANGYIANKAGLLTMTLPASGAIGDTFEITNMNTAVGWRIAQNANQAINFGTSTTTTGVGGYIEATALGDSIRCICIVAGASAIWQAVSSVGNLTIV